MGSVLHYIIGTVEIGFPAGEEIACMKCPLLGMEAALHRFYCRKSGEYIYHPEHQIGFMCPLNFNTEELPNV